MTVKRILLAVLLASALLVPAHTAFATQVITFTTLTDGQTVQRKSTIDVEVSFEESDGNFDGGTLLVDGQVLTTFGAVYGNPPGSAVGGGGTWDVPGKPNAPHTITVVTPSETKSITVYASQ